MKFNKKLHVTKNGVVKRNPSRAYKFLTIMYKTNQTIMYDEIQPLVATIKSIAPSETKAKQYANEIASRKFEYVSSKVTHKYLLDFRSIPHDDYRPYKDGFINVIMPDKNNTGFLRRDSNKW